MAAPAVGHTFVTPAARQGDSITSRGISSPVRSCAPEVGLTAHPFNHVRIVQFEGGPLRADAGQFGEVMARGWAAGGPLQRVAVSPWVVDGDHFAVAPTLEDVPHERQHRNPED